MNELIPLYREMAAGGTQFQGLSVMQHAKHIGKLIRQHHVRTLIDYGCGRGDAYRGPHKIWRTWGIAWQNVHLFDPAFPQHDKPPTKACDMVVCSDVLEHVPEADVPEFLRTLASLATRVVWASVCCRPAKKTFPQTGENLHVTVKPFEWWQEQVDAFISPDSPLQFVLVETP